MHICLVIAPPLQDEAGCFLSLLSQFLLQIAAGQQQRINLTRIEGDLRVNTGRMVRGAYLEQAT